MCDLSQLRAPPSKLLYRRSEVVVPCNATFNTSWELWLGTDPNRLMPLLNALEIEHYPLLQVQGDPGLVCPTGCKMLLRPPQWRRCTAPLPVAH